MDANVCPLIENWYPPIPRTSPPQGGAARSHVFFCAARFARHKEWRAYAQANFGLVESTAWNKVEKTAFPYAFSLHMVFRQVSLVFAFCKKWIQLSRGPDIG